jgi:hypothetical protein
MFDAAKYLGKKMKLTGAFDHEPAGPLGIVRLELNSLIDCVKK